MKQGGTVGRASKADAPGVMSGQHWTWDPLPSLKLSTPVRLSTTQGARGKHLMAAGMLWTPTAHVAVTPCPLATPALSSLVTPCHGQHGARAPTSGREARQGALSSAPDPTSGPRLRAHTHCPTHGPQRGAVQEVRHSDRPEPNAQGVLGTEEMVWAAGLQALRKLCPVLHPPEAG